MTRATSARTEERPDVLPERARLTRNAFVAGGFADENEPLSWPRTRRVEEIAVPRDGVRPFEAASEIAPQIVVQERRRPVATRKAPFLEPEEEHDVESPRPCTAVVEDGDSAGLGSSNRPHDRPLERRDQILVRDAACVELRVFLELGERAYGRAIRPRVATCIVSDRRRLETPRVSHHRLEQRARRQDRVGLRTQLDKGRDVGSAKLLGLLLDAGRIHDRASPQASFDEVHRATLEAGKRRAKEREELAASAAQPGVAKKRDEPAAESRLAQPRRMLEGIRNPECAEHGLEGRPPAIRRLAHDSDPLERRAATSQLEQLRADELHGAARACSLEELDRSFEWVLEGRPVTEEPAFEMHECNRYGSTLHGRQLRHRPSRQTSQVADRALERGEGHTSGLVRDRHGDVRPRGEGLDQRPLRCRQVLEAIREDRRAIPGVEIALDPFGRATPEAVSIPDAERAQLRAIRTREVAEIAADGVEIDQS